MHELTLCITTFKLLVKLIEEHNSTTKKSTNHFYKILNVYFKGKGCDYRTQYRSRKCHEVRNLLIANRPRVAQNKSKFCENCGSGKSQFPRPCVHE